MFNRKFVSAVIVSAGSSSRMKSDISKQLMKLGGRTVIENTAGRFAECVFFDEIIVVCPKGNEELYQELLGESIKITCGGATRQLSVYNGVCAASDKCDIVAIHDGARPLTDINDIENVVSDAIKFGAAVLAVPVKDTIKLAENGTVTDTPPRDKLYAVQTPQVFFREEYMAAYSKAKISGADYTDDCQLIESVGGQIHITAGSYTNIKITTPEDIDIAELLLRRGNK